MTKYWDDYDSGIPETEEEKAERERRRYERRLQDAIQAEQLNREKLVRDRELLKLKFRLLKAKGSDAERVVLNRYLLKGAYLNSQIRDSDYDIGLLQEALKPKKTVN